MNIPSNEFGILIEGCTYRDLEAVCELGDSEGKTASDPDHGDLEFAMVGGRLIETHPHETSLIFISFGDLSSGEFPPKPDEFDDIKARLLYLIAGLKVTWGFIETER